MAFVQGGKAFNVQKYAIK